MLSTYEFYINSWYIHVLEELVIMLTAIVAKVDCHYEEIK